MRVRQWHAIPIFAFFTRRVRLVRGGMRKRKRAGRDRVEYRRREAKEKDGEGNAQRGSAASALSRKRA